MEVASSSANTLQGPRSLSSREITHDPSDFTVINGHGTLNSYDEPDLDPFASLSQADAVAQVKELLQQRDYLQSNFAECTQTLSEVTRKCNELKEQELEKCNLAKKRIGVLVEEQATFKQQIESLNKDLAKLNVRPSTPTPQEALPPTEQLPLTIEEDNSQTTTDTPVEYCTSTPITLPGFSTSSTSSIRETEVEELKNQIQALQNERNNLTRRLAESQGDSQQQIQRIEIKRQTVERQCAAISTKFNQFRYDRDLELAGLTSSANALKVKNRDLESKLHQQAVEFDSSQRELLGEQSQRHSEEQREWQEKEQKILARCRELDASKTQIESEFQKRYQDLEARQRNLRDSCVLLQREKAELNETLNRSHDERRRSDDVIGVLRLEKQKTDDVVMVLKPIITECGRNIQRLQEENTDYGLQNDELHAKVKQLNGRIVDLNQSVGEEVPALIARCDDWKEKFKTEKAASEKQRAEVQELQAVHVKWQTDLDREKRHVQKLNTTITNLKQQMAKQDGTITMLTREIGELNSNNIQLGIATTQPAFIPNLLSTTPEDADESGDKDIAAGYSQQCIFEGCDKVGDSQFLLNHIERDH